ncbi:MAG: autotransporter-associated beta strand repeat-containing protein [Akkermansiaceae bacterium]|nr:autotransporter-associated beta strand repeat-containing protein [Akkermansiaceae bacterium]
MKSNRTNRFLGSLRRFFTTSTIVMSGFGLAHAADNTWTGAASTSWDTTSANWDSPTTWTNGDSALFPDGSGTVTTTEDITISGLSLIGAADRIAVGGGNTLLLDYTAAVPAAAWSSMIEGPGTLRLNSAQPVNGSADWGANSSAALPFSAEFTGTLIVDNGRMDSSPAGLGGISEITINNGGQFLGWTGTYLQPFTLIGDGWGEGGYPGALRAAAGNNCVFSADITLAGDAGILSQDGNSVVTFDGSVGGTGSLTLHTRGKFNFNGLASESYSGSLRINTTGGNQNNSTITFNKPAGMVAVPDNATVDFGYGTLNGQVNIRTAASDQFGAGVVMNFNNPSNQWSRLDLIGTHQTLAGVNTGSFAAQGGGVIQNGGIGIGAAGEATLTLDGSGDYLFNGHMRNQDDVGSGAFNLVKNGTGTQTLVGSVVTHTGLTTVNDGTLIFAKTNALNTSIENNATVEINSVSGDDWILNNGKTLSGAGTWNKTGGGRASFMNTTVLTTGQFNIQEGTLRNNNNFGNWTNSTASFDISSGAILDLFADAIYLDKLTGSGIVQNDYGNGSPNQTGASAFIEKLVVGVADGSSTFSGTLRNNGGANVPAAGTAGGGLELHKVGTGTLTLTGSLTYTGITNLDDGTLEIASPTNNTLAGAISGGGALVKANTGRLTLAGVNTLTGPTTINAGVLTLSGTAPNTAVTVKAGAGLRVNATGKTLSLVSLAGGTSLELPAVAAQTTTVGTLDLTATPALTVKPFFAAAPLVGTYDLLTATSLFGTAGAITTDFGLYDNARGVAGTTALSGGKLVLTVTGTFTGAANLVWTNRGGAGTGKWSAAIPADNNFSNGGSPDSFYDLDNVAFNGAAPGTINLTGPLFPGSITVNSSTGNHTFAGPGSIGGPTGLVKSGSSALTINTANTFTGGVTLNAGTLTLGSASALGGAPALTFPTGSTAALRLNGNPLTVSALNSGFPFIGSPIVESGSATAGADTLTVINSADNVFTGILRNGAARALALTKNGAGTLTFYGADPNTYTGDTTLLAGRIALSKAGGAIAIAGDFIGDNGLSPDVFTTENNQFDPGSVMYFVNPTGDHVRFELLGTTQTLAGIENSAAGGRGMIQTKEQAPAAAVSGTSTLILDVPESASYSYNGYLRDTGGILSLVKQGLGTQIFGGANITWTGGTTIDAGELVFASANVGRGAVTINDGGSLELAAPNATDSLGSITINAGGVINDGAAAHNVPQIFLNGGTMSATSPGLPSYGNFVLASTVTVGGAQTSVMSADIRVSRGRDGLFAVNPTGDPSGIDLDITGRIGHLNNVAWSFMTKTGAGTMRLNNPTPVNDIGRLTVTEGKMVLNNQMPLLGNGGLIFNGGIVELITAADVSLTYGGAMSGATGTFEKTGPGSLTLTNTGASFAGGFTVGGGLLSLPVRSSSYGDLAVAGGTKLTVAGTSGQFRASGLNLANGSALEIQNFVSDTGTPPMDVTTDPVTAGTVTLQVSGITETGVFPLIYYPPSGTVGGAGVAAFSLVTPRSIEAGVVDNTTNFSIDLNVTAVNPVTWKGNTGPVWDTAAGNLNWTLESVATAYQEGDLVLFDDSAGIFAVTLDETISPTAVTFDHTANDYTLSGTGTINGASKLTKTGDGKLTITGSHTYSGGTTVEAGTLELGNGTANGSLAGTIINEADLAINNGLPQTLPTLITGAGTVTKIGAGTLTVATAQTYTGPTAVNDGTLRLFNAGTTAGTTTVNAPGILALDGNINVSRAADFLIALNDGAVLNYATNSSGAAWAVLAGGVTSTGNTTINTTALSGNNNGGLFLDGGLAGTGTVTINASTAGVGVNLRNNASTFAGTLVVNGIASTATGVGSGIGVGGCTTALQTVDITLNGTMEMLNRGIGWANIASGAFQMGALNGTGVMIGNFGSGGGTTVTMGFTSTDGSFSGEIANGTGNIVNLVKVGGGTQTFSGANTYTGTTTVNGGTLRVMNTVGSGTGTGAVTVNDTATFGGTGTITGSVTIAAGGTVAPGASGIGILATRAATLTGTYLCEIDGATADRIDVTGSINATGGTIAFSAIATPSAAEYIIATYSGALDGDLPTITGLPAGYGLDLDTPGQIKLVKSGAGYDAWATLNGLDATNNGLAQDPDGDGISNLMEFYLDGDPLAGDPSILPDATLDATYLTLTFKRLDAAEADVTSQEVQFGANLVDWTFSTIGATSTPADGNGVIVTVTENAEDPDDVVIEIPRAHAADGKLFGRLQIVK